MEDIAPYIEMIRNHTVAGLGAAAALVVFFVFLNRKPRIARDAERQLAILTREKEGRYDKLRPPH
jgi:hypothetical protein